jgi:phage tail sheath protein FI
MVQVSYPGVYIQEVPSGVRAITGVSTSIGAFFGRSNRGPINRAVRIQSRSDFAREFGSGHRSSDLAASVAKFFDNGGQDCYVVRLAHGAAAAQVTLRNLDGDDVLVATARDQGAWGNGIRLEVDYNTASSDESFNLHVVNFEGDREVARETHQALNMDPTSARFAPDFVTQSSRLITLAAGATTASTVNGFSESRRPFSTQGTGPADATTMLNGLVDPGGGGPNARFEINVNDTGWVPINLAADPAAADFTDFNDVATQIEARINAQLPPGETVDVAWRTANQLSVLRVTATNGPSVHIRRASANDFAAPMMLGLEQGGVEVARFSELRPAPTATMFTGELNALAATTQDAIDEITISGRTVSLVDGADHLMQTTGATDPFYEDAIAGTNNGNSDGIREKLNIIAARINALTPDPTGANNFRAEVWGYHLALIPTSGTPNNAATVTTAPTNIGNLFTGNVRRYSLGATGQGTFQVPGQAGDDGTPPEVADYIGDELTKTGFFALDDVDIFNLMILPGDEEIDAAEMRQIVGPASVYCEQRRAFLLIDAPPDWSNNTLFDVDAGKVNALRSLVVKRNSAVFFPRIVYSDRGRIRRMGPSGAIAGVMARTDATRGVWKAPAGVEADLRAVLDLDVRMTDKQNGVMNKLGANALRKFPNGMVSWGARTLDGSDDAPSEWKYIPIRRFALFLEESLFRGTKWIVFEPNDEPLWANIRKNLRAFMMGLFRQGAFQGSTPDQAFYVKCDSETTIANDRNLGIVNIEVGFAPLKPAEFVVIKIQQIAETE